MNKNTKLSDTQKNITILFGYCLFALTVIDALIFTVIPMTGTLFQPKVMHFNVAVFLVFIVAGAILPVLVTYILGDRATHTKNKASHHYNGVLFGVAAYWLSILFSVIGSYTVSGARENIPSVGLAALVNSWPIVATIIVMTIVAISYAQHQKNKTSVLQHRPYQFVLLTAMAAFLFVLVFNQDFSTITRFIYTIVSWAIPIALICLSYIFMAKRQPTRLTALSSAVVAVSIGLIASSLGARFIAYLNLPIDLLIALSWIICLLVWALYMWIIVRKS